MNGLGELRAALAGSIEALAVHLLGEPNRAMSSRRQLRFGGSGGLAVEVSGPKRGTWCDHRDGGRGGGPLELVQHARGCSRDDAAEWARSWLGSPEPERRRARPAPAAAAVEDDDAARQDAARRMWEAGVPVEGTPAASYLTGTRSIPRPASGWPLEAMRWHAGARAWLLAVRDTAGALVAVQRVLLTPDGQNQRRADGGKIKLSLGPVGHGVVRLPGRLPVLIAEGPETATALWSATGHETWAALGGTGRLTPPAFALLAADDDKRHSPADKARRKALARWRAAGLDVLPVHPWPVRRADGSDFADLIAAEGPSAVKARISAALDPGGSAVRRVPLPVARVRLDRAVQAFTAAVEAGAWGDTPPVQAVRVDLGVGKSHAVRRELVAMLRRFRVRGDSRTAALMVPTHELGAEAAASLARQAPDLVVRVWRGRRAPAPGRAGAMCQQPDRVTEVRRLRLDVQEYACRGCPMAEDCEYLAQHHARADLWVVPAAMLHQAPPKALGELAALVVDEPPGPAVDRAVLPLLELGRYDPIEGDGLAGQRLRSLRRLVMDALPELPDGPLPRAALAELHMTEAGAAELLALEWRTHVAPDMPPGASPAVRSAALALAARNADLGRRTMLAGAVKALLAPDGPALSGLVELRTGKEGIQELHLLARREVRPGWRLPTLILDATLQPDLVRLSWPEVEVVADVAVEAPHQRVRQVADGGFTLSALDADAPGLDDAERRRRERNLARLRVTLHTEARRHAGTVLVVTNKRIRERLEALGMPGNVELVHFNALRGLDRWRSVAALVVVGWTLPPAAALEREAGALTGAAVPVTGYQRTDARRDLADGTSMIGEAWSHPDPLVEALRWSACDAELIQAIGRGRGVQRTAADPLAVLLLTEAVMPFQVDLVPLPDATPADLQLAHGAVAYAEPSHAARAYPQLYRSADTARKAWERWRTNPYGESLIGECPPPPGLVRVRYQREGVGQRPAEALVPPGCDPRAAIEAQQGPLMLFEVVPPPPGEAVQPVAARGAWLAPASLLLPGWAGPGRCLPPAWADPGWPG